MTLRRNAIAIVLLAAALWTSLPRMTRLVTEAFRLAPLAYEERRERVLGAYYASIRRIRTQLGAKEAVATSTRNVDRDVDGVVFANYYLYPRPTRFYATLDDYRKTVLSDPSQPRKFVRMDLGRTTEARLMSYLEIRAEELAEDPVVRDPRPGAAALREFVVPIAIAIDGQPGSAWLTEGVIVSDAEATATLTFFPGGESKSFSLRAGQPLVLRDAVYAIASRLDLGWIRVTASSPVRAGFWFVNRSLRHAAPLPLFERMPPMPQRVPGGERFWILNPADHAVDVFVNGEKRVIDAHALAAIPPASSNVVDSAEPVLAFSASRSNEREVFHWP